MNNVKTSSSSRMDIRRMVGCAMLSAVASILMFFDFSVPLMPSFIKMDLSDLPALVGSFAYGRRSDKRTEEHPSPYHEGNKHRRCG